MWEYFLISVKDSNSFTISTWWIINSQYRKFSKSHCYPGIDITSICKWFTSKDNLLSATSSLPVDVPYLQVVGFRNLRHLWMILRTYSLCNILHGLQGLCFNQSLLKTTGTVQSQTFAALNWKTHIVTITVQYKRSGCNQPWDAPFLEQNKPSISARLTLDR